MENRPQGRQKNVTGKGSGLYKRGSGLGTGPVGNAGGYSGRTGQSNQNSGQKLNGFTQRPTGQYQQPTGQTQIPFGQTQQTTGTGGVRSIKIGKLGVIIILVVVALLLFSRCGSGSSTGQTMYSGGYNDGWSSGSSSDWTSGGSSSGWSSGNSSSSGWSSGGYSSGSSQYGGYSSGHSSGYSSGYSGGSGLDLSSLLGGYTSSSTSSAWQNEANTGVLDTSVAKGSRAKYTDIVGGGRDTVTILVYMCGTDLESQNGMGSSDLKEMASATLTDKVNVIVYTGGCRSWRINGISNSVNQIYRVENNGLRCLVSDAGSSAMTKPETLASFIRWGKENYPADRMELILWDHGGGSLSGYGYDENYKSSGSMTLDGIDSALKSGGVKFDFIGFDACLMATLENGLMLTPYADYLIASEETEPGVGWYYTNWLSAFCKNTSMPTTEIGKMIVDDFVSVCNQKCSGQKTTLSVVDLAELQHTVPKALKTFAAATTEQIKGDEFSTVSKARSTAREFATSSKIDQVDLVSLAYNLGTDEAENFAEKLLGAIKYNKTSSNMTNAYGLSIFFPYQRASKVSSAVATYEAIGLGSEYCECIEAFAGMEVGGQAISGGASSPLSSLLGSGYSSGYSSGSSSSGWSSGYSSGSSSSGWSTGSSSSSGYDSYDMIGELLQGLMSGQLYGVSGLTGSNSGFLGRSLDPDSATVFLAENRFDADALVWTYADGVPQMKLSEDQWGLVEELELNVFVDDGEGYIDLGLDNVFDFTEEGALVGVYDGTWLAINGQVVAYYHTDTLMDGDNYTITGYVPVMLNDSRAELILVFDNDHPYGYIAGARSVYKNGETETVAKSMTELQVGDELDFLCDYYTYDGEYQDSYFLGERMTVTEDMEISNVYIDVPASATYRFTDIYCQQYWTPVIPQE